MPEVASEHHSAVPRRPLLNCPAGVAVSLFEVRVVGSTDLFVGHRRVPGVGFRRGNAGSVHLTPDTEVCGTDELVDLGSGIRSGSPMTVEKSLGQLPAGPPHGSGRDLQRGDISLGIEFDCDALDFTATPHRPDRSRQLLTAAADVCDLAPYASMQKALRSLYAAGARIDWQTYFGTGRYTPLPSYPWQKVHHWDESDRSQRSRVQYERHPMVVDDEPGPPRRWIADLSFASLPYLEDHHVADTVIFPAAGYVELALAARHALTQRAACSIEDLELKVAVPIDAQAPPQLAVGSPDARAQRPGALRTGESVLGRSRSVSGRCHGARTTVVR